MLNQAEILQETTNLGIDCPNQNQQTPLQNSAPRESRETMKTENGAVEGAETMDIDDALGTLKFSEPHFLRRVLREELGDEGSDHKLLVIAVHAVLLESRFIGLDSVSRMPVARFHLQDEWPSSASTVSLWYTLPELVGDSNSGSDVAAYVVIKFQNLGHFINVYGCLPKGGLVHRVCLDEHRFAPTLYSVWANCDKNDKMDEEISNFWRIVKAELALPLFTDLCESNGLAPPACLMRLPHELKLKILESLSGVDVARMGCVCTEMRYLASSNDLWKQKFTEEFGDETAAQGMVNWRDKFVYNWRWRKLATDFWSYPPIELPCQFAVLGRDPGLFGVSPIIGGNCYHFPGHAVPFPLAQTVPAAVTPVFQQTFWSHCNLER